MRIAYDKDDNLIDIDDTKSNQEYYCPHCGTPLITKKGDVRMHHFAHKNHQCKDSWEREGHTYDMSQWHSDWQNQFPINNREVSLSLGDATHRADVLIDRTVIEFQHSILSPENFDKRNSFYFNLGYKVIWLFDVEDLMSDGKITYFKNDENTLLMKWQNPKKAFNPYDVKFGTIDLFLQLYDEKEHTNFIVRVLDVSESGFEEFTSTKLMTKADFFSYIGFINGKCLLPNRMDLTLNEDYQKFKSNYGIKLNKQQELAMTAIEGNNLLLAVPGSGKTTVLVQRLGYMVFERHIEPKNILCLTYVKEATKEMEDRYIKQFKIYKNYINFSTINAISFRIYNDYCSKNSTLPRKMIDSKDDYSIKREILSKKKTFVSADDVTEFSSAINYVKNMMYSDEQIKSIDSYISAFSTMYEEYNHILQTKGLMDFDDQMIFAYSILKENTDFSKEWKSKYKYICVDEAQDTSKIQHSIIRLLAENNNLFMVGDEDQSIYGFRAAYPKAFLNFRTDYKNPFILKMETNYRCTPEIVEKAQTFISKNTGRYEKKMTSFNSSGLPVELIKVNSFEEQYCKCLEATKNTNEEIAFLYRDNVSAIVLADLLMRNNITFSLKKPEYNFFNGKYVSAIIGCLKLAIDSKKHRKEIFKIANAKYLHMHDNTVRILYNSCQYKDFYVSLNEQMEYVAYKWRHDGINLQRNLNEIKTLTPYDAVMKLITFYHDGHVSYDFRVLLELAKKEKSMSSFVARIDYLESVFQKDIIDSKNKITLSTVHTAKGKEFDNVYIIDVYDDRFPSSKRNYFNVSKDATDGEQEERRLFYVALTRAKKKLSLFAIKDNFSSYIDEIFPNQQEQKEIGIPLFARKISSPIILPTIHQTPITEKKENTNILPLTQEENIVPTKTKEEKEAEKKKLDDECFEEVKNKFDQQEVEVKDHTGRRWIKCEMCGLIAPITKFNSYGGVGKLNLGTCPSCMDKKYSNY